MSISSWSASSRWRFAGSEREQPGRRPFIAAPRHQLIGADKCARGFVQRGQFGFGHRRNGQPDTDRSEEHTSELQSLMRISYAVFRLIKKTALNTLRTTNHKDRFKPPYCAGR